MFANFSTACFKWCALGSCIHDGAGPYRLTAMYPDGGSGGSGLRATGVVRALDPTSTTMPGWMVAGGLAQASFQTWPPAMASTGMNRSRNHFLTAHHPPLALAPPGTLAWPAGVR
jgi:hypothetical protein